MIDTCILLSVDARPRIVPRNHFERR